MIVRPASEECHALLHAEDAATLTRARLEELLRVRVTNSPVAAQQRVAKRHVLVLSAEVQVPGIVLRDASGAVERIVDAADATPSQLEVTERNTGVYLLGADLLWKLLAQVGDDNAQGEIYLTDIVELADGL